MMCNDPVLVLSHDPPSQQVRAERERIVSGLENLSERLFASGEHDRWLAGADPIIRRVCSPHNSLHSQH